MSFYDKTVERYAKEDARSFPIKTAFDIASKVAAHDKVSEKELIENARFLSRELPIRLAWTLRDFQTLPFIVGVNPHIMALYKDYSESFEVFSSQMTTMQIDTIEDEIRWTNNLSTLLKKNQDAISKLSPGMAEVRMLPDTANIDFEYIDRFINNFIYQRLSRRTMASFHQALHVAYHQRHNREHWIGCFDQQCSPAQVAQQCFSVVSDIALSFYGRSPKLTLLGDQKACFTYHPIILENVLYEIFKNTVRALHESHDSDEQLPNVTVKICAGEEMTLIVSDRGGGIPTDLEDAVWGYGFSTHTPSEFDMDSYRVNFRSYEETDQTLKFAGYGFGLPMARAFIRYLGGELLLKSLPGYGTDVYIHIPPVESADIAIEGSYTVDRRKQ